MSSGHDRPETSPALRSRLGSGLEGMYRGRQHGRSWNPVLLKLYPDYGLREGGDVLCSE